MTRTQTRRSTLVLLAVATIVGPLHVHDSEAARGRGGGRGGGARAGGARTSVSAASRPSRGYSRPSGGDRAARGSRGGYADRGVNRNVNRDVSRDIDRDVDIDGDHGYYRGGRYYGGAPVARAAAVGITAAAIGSVAYSLPSGCRTLSGYPTPYYNCGGTYYAPQYQGSEVAYVVVDNPG